MGKSYQFKMKTKPWAHQLKALEFLFERNCGALYTVPGSGKTKVMIDLIVNKGFQRVLVVAPKVPCKDVWVDEILLHSDIKRNQIFLMSELTGKQKAEVLKQMKKPKPGDPVLIFICNYESVWQEPARHCWMYKKVALDCIICDESHKIKSPGGKASGFLAQLAKRVDNRYALTGTPMAERPEDVYAQYRFIDRSIFGTNYDDFCARYINYDLRASMKIGHDVKDKNKPYKNLDELQEKFYSCAFRMPPTIKLPEVSFTEVSIPMPDELVETYLQIRDDGAIEYEDGFMTIDNILAMSTRLQQITSGYLALEDDDGNRWLERLSTYRRTRLLKFIKGIPEHEPLVIFAKFKKDLLSIRKVAERLDCGYSEVSGRVNELSDWKQGQTRILGVQYGSGAEGINLTRSHICIFYSQEQSLAKYEQALKRTHRPGQKKKCLYYNFVATIPGESTVDQNILRSNELKKSYVDRVMDGEISL